MQDKIYKVTTEGDVEGRSTTVLGYATGHPQDIKAYFEDRKAYAIALDPIKILHITGDSAALKKQLLEKKKQLESELKSIKEKIESGDVYHG